MSRFSVPEMTCGHCKAKIEDALLDADGGAGLAFDMEKREVDVDSVLESAEVADIMREAGYESQPIG